MHETAVELLGSLAWRLAETKVIVRFPAQFRNSDMGVLKSYICKCWNSDGRMSRSLKKYLHPHSAARMPLSIRYPWDSAPRRLGHASYACQLSKHLFLNSELLRWLAGSIHAFVNFNRSAVVMDRRVPAAPHGLLVEQEGSSKVLPKNT